MSQNRDIQKVDFLEWHYVATVPASVLMRGIHPLKIFKMADIQGGMPLITTLARDMASAFWCQIIANHGVSRQVAVMLFWLSQPSVCLYSVATCYCKESLLKLFTNGTLHTLISSRQHHVSMHVSVFNQFTQLNYK